MNTRKKGKIYIPNCSIREKEEGENWIYLTASV
jgi:hypothetical protein